MSVRMRHTSGHTRNRRSHHALASVATRPGAQEGTLNLPHRLDEATGLYRGMQIANPAKVKKSKAESHDHPHGTHHEHAPRNEQSEQKPAEAKAAEQNAKTVARPRSRSGMGGGA